jgi:hypothetical protein
MEEHPSDKGYLYPLPEVMETGDHKEPLDKVLVE